MQENESNLIERVREGIRQAEKGRFVDHSKVVAWVNSWGTEDEKAPPEPEQVKRKRGGEV